MIASSRDRRLRLARWRRGYSGRIRSPRSRRSRSGRSSTRPPRPSSGPRSHAPGPAGDRAGRSRARASSPPSPPVTRASSASSPSTRPGGAGAAGGRCWPRPRPTCGPPAPARVTVGSRRAALPLGRRRHPRARRDLPARAGEVPPGRGQLQHGRRPRRAARRIPAAGASRPPPTAAPSTRGPRGTGTSGGPSCCGRSTRAASSSPRTTDGIAAVCAHDVTRAGFVGPVAVRPDLMGRGVGVAPLLGALHEMRRAGRTHGRGVVGRAGGAVRARRRDHRPGLPRLPQGAGVTEPRCPCPRELDLGDRDRSTPSREPRVTVGGAGLPAEGYALAITADGITLDAADAAGAFYGRATLAQLARLHDGRVPVGTVRDWPDLAQRGVMLDISRDKVPTMATLYALVDRLAAWKVNHVELYAEHTFAYPDHEVVWRDASPFTAGGDRGARRLLRRPPHHAGPEPELPRPHEPLAAARAVPRAGDGPRGLRDDGHAAAAEHDRAHRTRRRSRSCAACSASCSATSPTRGTCTSGSTSRGSCRTSASTTTSRGCATLRALPEVDGRELLVWGDILAPHPDRLGELPDGVTVCEWGYDAGPSVDAAPAAPSPTPASRAGSRRARRRGSRSSGRTTNMRADIAEAVDAGARARRRRDAQHRLGRQRAPAVPAGQRSRARVRRGDELVRGHQPRPRPRRRAERALLRRPDRRARRGGGRARRRAPPAHPAGVERGVARAAALLPAARPRARSAPGCGRRGVRRGRRRPRRARGAARARRRRAGRTPRCSATSCATRSRWCGCSPPTPGPASTSAVRSPRSARPPAPAWPTRSGRSSPSTSGCGSPATGPAACASHARGSSTCSVATRPGVTDRGWSGPQ